MRYVNETLTQNRKEGHPMFRRTGNLYTWTERGRKWSLAVLMFALSPIGLVAVAHAAFTIDSLGSAHTIDFAGYTGSGFSSTPDPGQLDSNTWATTGMSDGDTAFGGVWDAGDFARGMSSGGVSAGGFYAFSVGSNGPDNYALGVQSTSSDFTPGAMILRLQNSTGQTITRLNIGYTLHVFNNGNRSSTFNLEHSADNAEGSYQTLLQFSSPQGADSEPSWAAASFSSSIEDLTVPNDGFYYLRWHSDDSSGTGSRDELALDDITVTAGVNPVPIPGAVWLLGSGLIGLVGIKRKVGK